MYTKLYYKSSLGAKWVLFSGEIQEGGNNDGAVDALETFPDLNSMLSSFSWHHLSWELDTVDI